MAAWRKAMRQAREMRRTGASKRRVSRWAETVKKALGK